MSIEGDAVKSYYKLTWFSMMDCFDEAKRFEEASYFLKDLNNNQIHQVEVKHTQNTFRIKVNHVNLKVANSMGEAYKVLSDALNYKPIASSK